MNSNRNRNTSSSCRTRATDWETLLLLPEANPNKLDSYVSLPKQTKFNTCSHGHLYKEGIKTRMTYHDDGSGDWVLCSDDPDYEQYIMAGNPTHVPANPLNA